MAQHVDVQITIDGKIISPVSSVSLSQDIHQHHTFEVVLPADAFEGTSKGILQQSMDFIGKEVHIRFGSILFKQSKKDNEFLGLITAIGLNRSGNGERDIMVKGYSHTILLDGNLHCRSFTEKPLKEIANGTLEKIPHTLKTKISPVFTDKIPYVVQYKESNFDFLKRMAVRYGEWCFYDGMQLVFGKLPRENTIDLPFNQDLFDFEFSLKLMPVNFKALAYNYEENKTYQAKTSTAVNDLDEFGQFALQQSQKFYAQESIFPVAQPMAMQQQLNQWVDSQEASVAHNMVMNSGVSDNPYLKVGDIINITGETAHEEDYGEFIITSLVHYISETYSYQNNFTAIPAKIQSPPPMSLTNPRGEIQAAVVTDNADEKKLGRIRVRFPWQDTSEKTPWIRMAHPYGGNSGPHGFYFIPETGSEVLVGFEDDNPDKPFVLGNTYHGKSALDPWFDKKNNKKVIKTRNGNQIQLIDEDGKEQIRILNKDDQDATNEICLSLEEKGKITIKTKGKLSISAKSIDITAEEGISMTSGKDTQVKAQSVKVNADKEFALQAQKASMNAGQNLELTSPQVKVDGSAQLNISGGQSSIKAQMLQIDGGGMATVKAAVIQLN